MNGDMVNFIIGERNLILFYVVDGALGAGRWRNMAAAQ